MSRSWQVLGVLVGSVAASCAADSTHPVTCPGAGDYAFANVIVDAPGLVKAPSAINEPENAINGVVDGRPMSGSLDVLSRGLSDDPPNNYIVLQWSDRRLVDGEGVDLVIFENAFETTGGRFMDHAIVEVSEDGESWVAFPHDFVADDETKYSKRPEDWLGFAGTNPTLWRSIECTSPFAVEAGGDHFDLADLPVAIEPTFVRLTAAPTVVNPDTGAVYPRDPISDGFDLDGVYARYVEPLQ